MAGKTSASTTWEDGIAIVGMACHFPGSRGLEAFWQLLTSGDNAITAVDERRWKAQHYLQQGLIRSDRGGFVDNIRAFDAAFFGIKPAEARAMDPQQRLLLQVVWQALENAGIVPAQLRGSRTGVYTGCATGEYFDIAARACDASDVDVYLGIGNSSAATSGRVAYVLGTQGPALTTDTACSSSLVSAHLGCRDLLGGTVDLALISGTSALLNPFGYVNFSRARMLSPQGRCNTFDAAADGYVRAEGSGTVVCRRLSDALAAGDRIWAVIRGSAVNQDGASNGFTAPNGRAQVAVYREALATAGLAGAEVDWVECHGTGTRLGDPIEVDGLQEVYGNNRERPLYLSSVKANIGHLEASAGIAGLIKVALSLHHCQLPAHLNLTTLNPLIRLREPTRISRELIAMKGQHRWRAAVSSFGITGTNCHTILDSPPTITRKKTLKSPPVASQSSAPLLAGVYPVTAASRYALRRRAGQLAEALRTGSMDPESLAGTLWLRQQHLPLRSCLLAQNRDALQQQLEAMAAGDREPEQSARGRHKLVFAFGGGGEIPDAASAQLYSCSTAFSTTVDACTTAARQHLGIDPGPQWDSTNIETAAARAFTMELALARFWLDLGLSPAFVLGSGLGEYVAAAVAGVLDLETGIALCHWYTHDHKRHTKEIERVTFSTGSLRVLDRNSGAHDPQWTPNPARAEGDDACADAALERQLAFARSKAATLILEPGLAQEFSKRLNRTTARAAPGCQVERWWRGTDGHPARGLARLFEAGCALHTNTLEPLLPQPVTTDPPLALPPYPFEPVEYWYRARSRRDLDPLWQRELTLDIVDCKLLDHHGHDTTIAALILLPLLASRSLAGQPETALCCLELNALPLPVVDTRTRFCINAWRDSFLGHQVLEIQIGQDDENHPLGTLRMASLPTQSTAAALIPSNVTEHLALELENVPPDWRRLQALGMALHRISAINGRALTGRIGRLELLQPVTASTQLIIEKLEAGAHRAPGLALHAADGNELLIQLTTIELTAP